MFRFPTWIVLIPVAIALGLIGLAVLGFKKGPHPILGYLPLGFALVPGLLFAPGMFLDRVEVSSDRIQQTTGLFFSRNRKGFEYKDVEYVHIKQALNRSNRPVTLWEIHEKSGVTRDVDPGDLWDMNSTEIVTLLKKHGVRFQ